MKNRKIKNSKKVNDVIEAWQKESDSNTNALGSYTGTPNNFGVRPEQDADDL